MEPLDPVSVANTHEIGDPVELLAALEKVLAEIVVPATVSDVPLTAGDDLERPISLFVELDRVHDLTRLSLQISRLSQHLCHLSSCLVGEQSGDLPVGLSTLSGEPIRGLLLEAAIRLDHGAGRQIKLPPPSDIGQVAEGTDHGDTCPLFRIGELVSDYRKLHPEDRRSHRRLEELLVSVVFGMGHQCHTGADQLGSGRLDVDRTPVTSVESDLVVGAPLLPILELGLGHRSLEIDVPENGCLLRVSLAPLEIVEESLLRGLSAEVVDGRVSLGPIHREAKGAPDVLEDLFVLVREDVAQLDEVATADVEWRIAGLIGRGEVGVVGERGVALDAVVILNASLGG